MSKSLRFDVNQFPLLKPKAFAMPDTKEYESKKAVFLVGAGKPPGVYGKDAKLEYDYQKPEYKTQFTQLLAGFTRLAQELELNIVTSGLDNVLLRIVKSRYDNFNIAANQKKHTFQLFKQQLEDILFGMREAYTQAVGNPSLIKTVTNRIRNTLIRLDEAFTHCSEGTTEAIMEQQIVWMPSSDVAVWLLKRRDDIVSQVASGGVTTYGIIPEYESHAGTAAHLVAAALGYAVASPGHDDKYNHPALSQFKANAPKLLQQAFYKDYTYEALGSYVCQELIIHYKNLLKSYARLERLTRDEHDAVRDKFRVLSTSGVCKETDLFAAIPQTNGLTCIHPGFLAQLPMYCAFYALHILEQQGFVKNIGQLPVKTKDQRFSGLLDDRIKSSRSSAAQPQEDFTPILLEQAEQGHFFIVFALLNKKHKDAKEENDAHSFVFNPFHKDITGQNLLEWVCSNTGSHDAKGSASTPRLQHWQRDILLSVIFQHPAATREHLTGVIGTQRLFNYVIQHGSNELFNLYLNRLLSLYQGLGHIVLATKLNEVDDRGKTALTYALGSYASDSKDPAKVKKIAAIPGVNVKGYNGTALLVCLNAIETEKFEDANIYFTQSLLYESAWSAVADKKAEDVRTLLAQADQCKAVEQCSAIHKPLKHYEKMIQLLKARYGILEYPHHKKYLAFLQYLAEHEKYIDCLLILKKENPAIDLDQPRALRLKTDQEVKETPLRAAIQDDDDVLMTRLLDEALADPDTEVNEESAWLLVANKTKGLSPERQIALLELLMDKNGTSEINNLESLLVQLASPERTDTAFGYILGKLHQDKRHDYHTQLGENAVEAKEFVTGKEVERKEQKQILFGREEAKADPEMERVAVARRLGAACNQIKDAKGQDILYGVVVSYQPGKLMSLLTETMGLDFSQAFAIPGLTDLEQKSRETKHESTTNRDVVENLLRLIYLLRQRPTTDYSIAQQCFAEIYATQKNSDYYQKLLMMIHNHSPKDRVIVFFKQLAATEQNVICRQHLRKYVPIDLIKTAHYAARWDCSTQQFATIWQEMLASLPDLSQAYAQLNLAELVRYLLEAPQPEQAEQAIQQRDKLFIVLSDFSIIAYIRDYKRDYKPTATSSLSPLNRLISLLQALEQGSMVTAITYYLIDQQQTLTEDIAVTKPMARILTQQWGSEFLTAFSRQLAVQFSLPTGLLKIQNLIVTEEKSQVNSQQAARLLLRQTQSGQLPSRDLLTNLDTFLQLHFLGNSTPWIFSPSLIAFCQSVLAHCSAHLPQQLSIVFFIMPRDIQAAAQLFCSLLLTTDGGLLLPENLILEKLKTLQQAAAQSPLNTYNLSEFFSYIIGQLVVREDFHGYDQLLTFFFTTMNTDHPFCQTRKEGGMALSSPMHVALRTDHLDFLETTLTSTEAKKLRAAEDFNGRSKSQTHLMRMLEIKDRAQREKLISLWLTHDNTEVCVETVDEEDGNHALLKVLSSDEKMAVPADERTALQIWEYILQAFPSDSKELKQVVEHKNKKGESIFQRAIYNKHETLALRLLESVRISIIAFYTLESSLKIQHIINMMYFIMLTHSHARMEYVIEKFFNCIDQDEKTSEFNTDQVIRVIRVIVKQFQDPDHYKGLFFYLLSRYSHNKVVASALLQAGSKFKMVDLFKMTVETGNAALMQILLEHKPVPDAELCHTTLISLLEESQQYEYSGIWGEEHENWYGTTSFTTPQMAYSIRYNFIDLFLPHDAHLNQERKLTQAIKDCAIKPSCYFTVFLKLFNHDHHYELLAVSDQKDLSPQKRIFLNLVKILLDNPADKSSIYSVFKQLLLLIENDIGVLPMLLGVLKKKFSEERIVLFLNEYLQSEQRSAPDPEACLINNARLSQAVVTDSLRFVDEKGGVTLVPAKIPYALNDGCNFATFIYLLSRSRHPFKNNHGVATSDLSLKKHCVLQMLASEYKRISRPRMLEFLALSLDEKEFKNVLSIFYQRVGNLDGAVGDLLADSIRLVQIYQNNPAALHQLVVLYTKFEGCVPLPNADSICHLLIRNGCWNEATHWLKDNLNKENNYNETPFDVALKRTIGDAQQRLTFFQTLAAERTSVYHPGENIRTDIMAAAESHCDMECFQELLKACDPKVITQVWRNFSGSYKMALSLAAEGNQPAKVRLLLEQKEKFPLERQFDVLNQAQQQNKLDVVNIFWEQNKDHQLDECIMGQYYCGIPLARERQLPLATKAFYRLYVNNIRFTLSAELPNYGFEFYLAVIQHYGGYAQLFADEKTGGRSMHLLEYSRQVNTTLFASIPPLTYAVQNKQAYWLLPHLFATSSLTISAQQIRLIHSNIKLHNRWLLPALQKQAAQDIRKAIASLVQCYTDELQTAEAASAASVTLMSWVDGLKPSLADIDFYKLCLYLLRELAKQFFTCDDVASFIALYNQVRFFYSNEVILDLTTDDTAITFAAQYGSPQLLKELLALAHRPCVKKNGSEQSALELALLRRDKAVIQVMLEAKIEGGLALWPIAEGAESSILMLAVQLGDLSICQNIVEHAQHECKEHFTAFLNYKNAAGKSALYLATELQREDIVRWLLTVPGIDREAYCATTHRTAALCCYTMIEAKVEVSGEAAAVTVSSAMLEAELPTTPTPQIARNIFQIFVDQKVINPEKVAVEHRLATVAQYSSRGQQVCAAREVLILLEQQDLQPSELCGTLREVLEQEAYHALIPQLGVAVLRRAAIHPEHLSILRYIILGNPTLVAEMGEASLRTNLQRSTILFSEATLDALSTDPSFKPLWPAAALAYARVCRNRPQHLANQLLLIQKIFTTILSFSVAEAAGHNEILPVVIWELTQAQQKFLTVHQTSERFPQWYQYIRSSRQAMMQQSIDRGDYDQCNLALTNSKIDLEAKEVRYLVDVNISFPDIKTEQPPAFTVLAKAKQEPVAEEDAKHKPYYTILKMLISHPTWQDDDKDSTEQTLLMRAISVDPRIFSKILSKIKTATLLMSTPEGKTAMDLVHPGPTPNVASREQKTSQSNIENNPYENAKSLAARLQKEFNLCIQQIRNLQADPNATINNSHGETLNVASLREQARHLALELLKFDTIQAKRFRKNSLVYSSLLSAISPGILLGDIKECQQALQSGRLLNNQDLTERADKLPKFFIQQLVAAWETLVPSPPSRTEANNTAQTKAQGQEPPSTERRLTFALSKVL